MKTYKVWLEIEEISNVGEFDEDYRDISPFPHILGEFETQEAAEEFVEKLCEIHQKS